jgi:hypothetical protein
MELDRRCGFHPSLLILGIGDYPSGVPCAIETEWRTYFSEHDFDESISGEGLIVALMRAEDKLIWPVHISRCRRGDSHFVTRYWRFVVNLPFDPKRWQFRLDFLYILVGNLATADRKVVQTRQSDDVFQAGA